MKRILFICLALVVCRSATAQICQDDFEALKGFYEATGGPDWKNRSGWDFTHAGAADVEVYDAKTGTGWFGITEIRNGRVCKLELPDNNLSGQLPDALWELTALRSLNLANNRLTGTISPRIGAMKALSVLVLTNNGLTGPIPDELLEVGAEARTSKPRPDGKSGSQIKVLLNKNRLTGEIPARIGEMALLAKPAKSISLDLGYNQLTGGIPESMRRLEALTTFKAAGNRLSGEVPDFLAELPGLKYLHLEKNDFTGDVPRKNND